RDTSCSPFLKEKADTRAARGRAAARDRVYVNAEAVDAARKVHYLRLTVAVRAVRGVVRDARPAVFATLRRVERRPRAALVAVVHVKRRRAAARAATLIVQRHHNAAPWAQTRP